MNLSPVPLKMKLKIHQGHLLLVKPKLRLDTKVISRGPRHQHVAPLQAGIVKPFPSPRTPYTARLQRMTGKIRRAVISWERMRRVLGRCHIKVMMMVMHVVVGKSGWEESEEEMLVGVLGGRMIVCLSSGVLGRTRH
uniref:Uncharacterized protein n=1 Tax=Cacopsylla melanoneura TaxID=428564 RepID=A0A8D8V9E9_9HEMI